MLNQVSIVIPTLERPHMLERSIGSCLCQTVPPLEVLVVDNGDHPGTIEIVEKLNRNKSGIGVRRLASEKGNLSKALTLGFESAQGDWTIHLDDDDLLVPTRVELDIELGQDLADNDVGIVHDFVRVDYNGSLVWQHSAGDKPLGLKEALVLDHFPPPPALTWRSELLKKYHPFHTKDGRLIDYIVYANLLAHGQLTKSHQCGYIQDDTRIPGRLSGLFTRSIGEIDIHRENFRELRSLVTANEEEIDQRLDAQIAFYSGRSNGLKVFYGEAGSYARAHPIEALKGMLSPFRAFASRYFSSILPEVRGSRSYTLDTFAKQSPEICHLIQNARLKTND